MTSALIVDDSRLAQQFARKALLEVIPEIDLTCAKSGEEAIELASELDDLTIALIDFNMPGIDGIECGARLRESFPEVLMVLVTANIQQIVADRARKNGLAVASKPCKATTLRVLLGELVE